MKRSLAILVITLLAAVSLTACGRDDQQDNGGAGTNDTANGRVIGGDTEDGTGGDAAGQDDGTVSGDLEDAADNAGDAIEDTGDAIVDGAEDVGDAVTGSGTGANGTNGRAN